MALSLMIYASSVAALLALPDFFKNNGNKAYTDKADAVKNEGLLLSLGVGTRYGNMFRIDDRGIKLAKYGFKLE